MIIFDEQGNVLLQKRADVGLWGIPSGHVEPGETVVEAAVREIWEETGLQTRVNRLMGIYSITTCFETNLVGGTAKNLSPESLDVRFFRWVACLPTSSR